MNKIVTQAIVLSRVDYGEADRILTLLTPDLGKIGGIAKGVRRVKSKLAGGIELFSVSEVTLAHRGQGLHMVVSARLIKHYGGVLGDYDRTMLGYEMIKRIHRITEDESGGEYFDLLRQAFAALDDATLNTEIIRLWFYAQLLRIGGHTPNLQTDTSGEKLAADKTYDFGFEQMAFAPSAFEAGGFAVDHIKLLRLSFSNATPKILSQVNVGQELVGMCANLVVKMETWRS